MSEEEATSPEEGVEPEEIEADEADAPEADEEPVEVTDDDDGDDTEDDEEEEVEINFGGDKLRMPKGAIPDEIAAKVAEMSRNLESGYTKKFQTLSEQRTSLEAREKTVEKLQSLDGEALEKYSRGNVMKQELAQLQQIDINRLWQSKPDQARKVSDRVSQLTGQFNAIVNDVSRLEGESEHLQQVEIARREEEGHQEVERRIPGFAEKHANDLVKYAISNGIPKREAELWQRNPVVTEMAWKAMQYDAVKAKASKASKPKTADAEPIKPSRSRGSKTRKNLVSDADSMSTDEWMRMRNEQVNRRG
jgi:hypothetical protein